MRNDEIHTIYVELSQPLVDWIATLTATDLGSWSTDERCGLTKEDASAFAMFLQHSISDAQRQISVSTPTLRAS